MADNTYYVEDYLSGLVPIDDGTGTDWIIITGTYAAPLSGNTYGASILMYFESPDSVEFTVRTAGGGLVGGGVVGLIENAQGGGGDELIHGNVVANLIYGDPIDVAGGRDELYGRGGADQIFGAGGSDLIYGGTENDWLFGDIDPFSQDQGNYIPGDDTVHGNEGNDTVYGGWGNNALYGDEGYDTADYRGFFDDFGNTTYRIVAHLESGLVTVYARDTIGGIESVVANDTLSGFEVVRGTSGNDRIEAPWSFAPGAWPGTELHGEEGNDYLTGTAGVDALYGGKGNDLLDDYNSTLPGVTGVDLLNGGDGDDTFAIRKASTVVIETELGGYDRIQIHAFLTYAMPAFVESLIITNFAGAAGATGNALDNQLEGNSSANDLGGLGGNDYLFGFGEADILRGGAGLDSLYGGDGNDQILGGAQNDLLLGEAGDDSLFGGSEADSLNGSLGNDLLQGGLGRDTLRGGAGRDVFVFADATESQGNKGRDTITDFASRADKIDLSGVEPGQVYIGAAAFSATGRAELRHDSATGFLSGDIDGNGTTDYMVFLGVGTVLAARDLIL